MRGVKDALGDKRATRKAGNMTYSVVALSSDAAALGVATASRSLAVGAGVPALAPGVGGLVTQAYTNQRFRARGLQILREGATPIETIEVLRKEDPDFDTRQVGIVDVHGRTAVWTGPLCTDWKAAAQGPGWVALGNYLAGPRVVPAMAASIAGSEGVLSHRLMDALEAAQAAGGDARGQQSAALMVVHNDFEDIFPPLTEIDLRVDNHGDPLEELRRMRTELPVPGGDAEGVSGRAESRPRWRPGSMFVPAEEVEENYDGA